MRPSSWGQPAGVDSAHGSQCPCNHAAGSTDASSIGLGGGPRPSDRRTATGHGAGPPRRADSGAKDGRNIDVESWPSLDLTVRGRYNPSPSPSSPISVGRDSFLHGWGPRSPFRTSLNRRRWTSDHSHTRRSASRNQCRVQSGRGGRWLSMRRTRSGPRSLRSGDPRCAASRGQCLRCRAECKGWAIPLGPLEESAAAIVRQSLAVAKAHYPDLVTKGEHCHGFAGNVLVEFAKSALLLVVGSRGHSQLADLLLGSVSEHCVHHASCPTLVVH